MADRTEGDLREVAYSVSARRPNLLANICKGISLARRIACEEYGLKVSIIPFPTPRFFVYMHPDDCFSLYILLEYLALWGVY